MSTVPNNTITFTSIVTAYNNAKHDLLGKDKSTSNISLSSFRGEEFTSGLVPSSGPININSQFRGKTFKFENAPPPKLTNTANIYWDTPTGSGTSSDPYDSYSNNANQKWTSAAQYWRIDGPGTLYANGYIDSKRFCTYLLVDLYDGPPWYGYRPDRKIQIHGRDTHSGWVSFTVKAGQYLYARHWRAILPPEFEGTDKSRVRLYTTYP